MQYAGYVLWRGLADESSVSDIERFEDRITWAVSGTGYCPLYIVPSRAEDVAVGKRQVNWVLYENVADTALPGVLTDARGVSIPRRFLRVRPRPSRSPTSAREPASSFSSTSATWSVPRAR